MKTFVVGGWWLVAKPVTILTAFLLVTVVAFAPLAAQTALPTKMPQALADSLRADSLAAARGPISRADTTLIIKHHFNHRQQIITGSIIMACAAAMVVVMNNYNPQTLQQ